jgi:transcriptional regulator with XRE-family HTH domain
MFPFPDREHLSNKEERKWRNSELAMASGNHLSGSYLSSLRREKIDDPGFTKLDLLARVMGFPTELWVLEPGEWEERLDRNTRPGVRPENLVDERFAARLQKAFRRTLVDTVSGMPVNNPYEVARRSAGHLTEKDINAMLEGRMLPNLTQLLALCERLQYSPYDWRAWALESLEGESSTTAAPRSFARQLIDRETRELDEDELEVTLQFARQLKELRARRAGRSTYSAETGDPGDEEDPEDLPGS